MNAVGPTLEAARRHRSEFGDSLDALERWTSAPTTPGWGPELAERVGEVEEYLAEHIALVEEPRTGLFAEIVAIAPRLAHAVERLREEHPRLADRARTAVRLARAVGEPPASPAAAAAVDAARLLTEGLRAHRRRGARIVYEAYDLDLGDAD